MSTYFRTHHSGSAQAMSDEKIAAIQYKALVLQSKLLRFEIKKLGKTISWFKATEINDKYRCIGTQAGLESARAGFRLKLRAHHLVEGFLRKKDHLSFERPNSTIDPPTLKACLDAINKWFWPEFLDWLQVPYSLPEDIQRDVYNTILRKTESSNRQEEAKKRLEALKEKGFFANV